VSSAPAAIAHVLSSFAIGGQERLALELATGQRAAGHRVLAVSLARPPDGPLASEFARAGIEVASVAKRGGVDPTLPPRLALRLHRFGAELVHTHNPQALIYGAPAARLCGARAVHTKHGANPDRGRRLWLRRAAARLVDAYVAVSDATAQVARTSGEAKNGKLRVIPNGIDVERFRPDPGARVRLRAELGIAESAWVVGTVGRLAPEKDQELLLRAAAPLCDGGVHLLLVGDGPRAQPLQALARTLGVAHTVHFVGARSDVAALLAAMDVFVLSSRTEGLPLVVPEAMAAGLPVVSTAVGGIPGVIDDGATGFLVPAGDEARLRERLEALDRDRERARACGQRARQVAEAHYSARRMVRDYLDLYDQVLRRP
jgi:sugar transferase (PEP-CTERM/EpsH1 system associated)